MKIRYLAFISASACFGLFGGLVWVLARWPEERLPQTPVDFLSPTGLVIFLCSIVMYALLDIFIPAMKDKGKPKRKITMTEYETLLKLAVQAGRKAAIEANNVKISNLRHERNWSRAAELKRLNLEIERGERDRDYSVEKHIEGAFFAIKAMMKPIGMPQPDPDPAPSVQVSADDQIRAENKRHADEIKRIRDEEYKRNRSPSPKLSNPFPNGDLVEFIFFDMEDNKLANEHAAQAAFGLSIYEAHYAFRNSYVIRCTPSQYARFLIWRSMSAKVNRIKQFNAHLIPASKTTGLTKTLDVSDRPGALYANIPGIDEE